MKERGISGTANVFSLEKKIYLNFLDKKRFLQTYIDDNGISISVFLAKKSFDSCYLSVDSGLCMLIFSTASKSISHRLAGLLE